MLLLDAITPLSTKVDTKFSSTSGGRSVGVVRSRTKGHGVCLFVCLF
jgi:hypothetical protein